MSRVEQDADGARAAGLPDDAARLVDALVGTLTASAELAVRTRGRCHLVLGVSPASLRIYQRWAKTSAQSSFWHYTIVFLADEVLSETVPVLSSGALLQAVLLAHVPIPRGNVHLIELCLSAEQSAVAYERTLRMALELRPGELPCFDLVLLGLDPEPRRTSRHPPPRQLEDLARLVLAYPGVLPGTATIMLTAPALSNARDCVLVTSARAEAEAARMDAHPPAMDQLLAARGTLIRRVVLPSPVPPVVPTILEG